VRRTGYAFNTLSSTGGDETNMRCTPLEAGEEKQMGKRNNKLRRGAFGVIATAVLFVSQFGFAQDLPDSPSVTMGLFPSIESANKTNKRNIPAPAGRGPFIDGDVADLSYWSSTAALFATTIVNVEMTARCSREHTCMTAIDSGIGRGRMYAYTLPTDFLVSYLAYRLKPKTHLWIVPQIALTGGNLFSAGRSYGRIR
jgi:hypothetical protein